MSHQPKTSHLRKIFSMEAQEQPTFSGVIRQPLAVCLQELCQRFKASLIEQVAQLHVIANMKIDVVPLLNGSNKSVVSNRAEQFRAYLSNNSSCRCASFQRSMFALRSPPYCIRIPTMARPPRAFVAFDYDYDSTLRDFLFGQSKHPDTNFEMHDWSVKEPFASSNWKERVRTKIRASDLVIVLCGERTNKATGVDVELKIAQEENKPYLLLAGYADKTCTRPPSARASDKLYRWTWDNLKNLVNGAR